MICQEVQTHVVHYSEADHLALTALVNIENGEEMRYDDLCLWAASNEIPVVEKFDKSLGTVLAEDRPNKEGYVLTWHQAGQPPLKVKVKHETFLAMQKIAHEATPKAILEALMDGQDELIDKWAAAANPELASFVQGHAADFRAKFMQTLQIGAGIATTAQERYDTRKAQAVFLLKDEGHKFFSGLAFALLDKKGPDTIRKIVWKLVKEQEKELSDQPLVAEEEEDTAEV